MRYLFLAIVFVSNVVLAQSFTINSVSEHIKLPKAQQYQNGAPFGFTEYLESKEGWKFLVINGEFKAGISVSPKEIYVTTSAGNKRYPVGMVTDDGDFYLSNLGLSSLSFSKGELENSRSPIFVLEKSEKATEIYIGNEQIKLPKISQVEVSQSKLPKIKVLSAKFIDEFYMDYSLIGADVTPMERAEHSLNNFDWKIAPIKGKLLSVEIEYENIENVDDTELRAISLYDTRGFVSYAVRFVNSMKMKSHFGTLRDGKFTLIFVVPKDSQAFELHYKNRKVVDVKL